MPSCWRCTIMPSKWVSFIITPGHAPSGFMPSNPGHDSHLCWKKTVFFSKHDKYCVYVRVHLQLNSLMSYSVKDISLFHWVVKFIFVLNNQIKYSTVAASQAYTLLGFKFHGSNEGVLPDQVTRSVKYTHQCAAEHLNCTTSTAHMPQCLTSVHLWNEASEEVTPADTCTCRRASDCLLLSTVIMKLPALAALGRKSRHHSPERVSFTVQCNWKEDEMDHVISLRRLKQTKTVDCRSEVCVSIMLLGCEDTAL